MLTDIALGAVVIVGALFVFVLLLCTMICVEWYVQFTCRPSMFALQNFDNESPSQHYDKFLHACT